MAVRFDTNTDQITRTTSAPTIGSTGFTFLAWIYLSNDRGDYSTWFRIRNAGGTVGTFATRADGNTVAYFTLDGSIDSGGTVMSAGGWYRVAISIPATGGSTATGTLYSAPAAGSTVVETGTVTAANDSTIITIGGRGGGDSSEWFDGRVVYARIWQAQLSQAEIEAEWRSTTPVRTSGLWADYPLTSASDLTDHSGNGRDLTAGSTAVTTEADPDVRAPATISGQVLWLNADDLTGTLADGDPVSTWTDASASGLNVTSSGSNRPTLQTGELNGHAVVRFDGSNDYLSNAASATATGSGGWTVFAVVKRSSASTIANAVSNGNGNGYILSVFNTGKRVITARAIADVPGGTYTPNTWEIWTGHRTGGVNSTRLFVNGAVEVHGGVTYSNASGGLVIGAYESTAAQFWDGDIAEVIAYSRGLTGTELEAVHTYLATKYALTENTARIGFGTVAPTDIPQNSDASNITLATAFRVNQSGLSLTKARLWVGAATVEDKTGQTISWALYAQNPSGAGATGSALTSGSFSSIAHNTWNESTLGSPYALTADTDYYLAVYWPGGNYYASSVSGQFDGDTYLPGGLVFRQDGGDSSAAGVDSYIRNGSFKYATGISPTDSSFNAKWYGIDAQVAAAGGGSDATITPSVISGSTTFPSATVSGGATVTPAAISGSTTFPAATKAAGATVTPSAISGTTTFPAATKAAGATVTPSAISGSTTFPAATVTGTSPNANITPAVISGSTTFPTVTVSGGAGIAAAAISTSTTFPAAAESGGATVVTAVISTATTMPAPTLTGNVGATITPAVITAVTSFPAATVSVTGQVDTGSWYTLLSIVQDARISAREDATRRMLACPNDGEPFRTGPDGQLFCPFDGYRP